MVIARLLLNAAGSILMVFALLVLGAVLNWLVGRVWALFGGDVWKLAGWSDRWNLCQVPGAVVQVWYAGFAADQVHAAVADAPPWYAALVHAAGVLGVLTAAAVFDGFYRRYLQRYWRLWPSLAVAGLSLSAYGAFLLFPDTATRLGWAWGWVIWAVAMIL